MKKYLMDYSSFNSKILKFGQNFFNCFPIPGQGTVMQQKTKKGLKQKKFQAAVWKRKETCLFLDSSVINPLSPTSQFARSVVFDGPRSLQLVHGRPQRRSLFHGDLLGLIAKLLLCDHSRRSVLSWCTAAAEGQIYSKASNLKVRGQFLFLLQLFLKFVNLSRSGREVFAQYRRIPCGLWCFHTIAHYSSSFSFLLLRPK